MKRMLMVAAILMMASCASGKGSGGQYFATSDGLVELQFPAGWYEKKEEHPYELQCLSKDGEMTTGVFVFVREDLAQDITPGQILDLQIQDLNSKRRDFQVVEEMQTAQREKTTLTSVVYSGVKDVSRYYYRFTLVEFTENPEVFLVTIQVTLPSSWKQNKPILEQITASARVKP